MTLRRMTNDSVHWYMQDLTSRVVAQSGIPTDRHHLGKIILQSLKDAPDFVLQIDGATGETETFGSVLERSVRCAQSLRNFGLKHGDVMILMAPNHLDITVPLYAALYLGIVVAAIDRTLHKHELQQIFAFSKPAIIFCQSDVTSNAQLLLSNLNMNTRIITFDKADHFCHFTDFMEQYGDDTPTEDFKCSDFDPEESIAYLIGTSGTTGFPKAVAHSHKYIAMIMPYIWIQYNKFPTPTRLVLVGSPLHWTTGMTNFIRSPILRYTRLQTRVTMTQEHAYYLINTYKPTYSVVTPILMRKLLKPHIRDNCDFTSFETLMLGGCSVPQNLIDEVKAVAPNAEVLNIYGLSELAGLGFYGDNPAPGSCGKPMGCFQYRIVDIETHQDIYESNAPGELWMKGPCPFKGYYNDIEATKESFTKDGWLKTGDMFYRDENWNFFYVDRIKLQLKYLYFLLSPLEIEGVIRKHPDVLDVAVTSVLQAEVGDLPVACVVPRPGARPNADEIKNLVKDSLQDEKQLRGGVIFIDSLPMTASSKVHRRKLKEMALPTYSVVTPILMRKLLKPHIRDNCDFTSFETLMLGGCSVPQNLIDEVKAVAPNAEVLNIYGLSELAGLGFYGDNPAPGSCGKPMGCFQYRIVDIETHQDIYESNAPGELWMKGPCPFKGYYNDIEATKESFTKDGWLKTGDMFYRDENWNFFYVDRIKLQLKYLYFLLSPLEIEGVIRKHPDVLDVAVTSVLQAEVGDLPVACVVPRPGARPNADEIKNLVKDSLQDEKQLRGGVIFIDSLPMTASSKVHRRKLKEMALVMHRA